MKSEFWHDCWKNNQIGFHEHKPNENLVSHIHKLGVESGSRWLLPLCGKTLDIAWLVSQGYKVVGIELSELAIQQLFEVMNVQAVVTQVDNYKHYRSENIDIWVGDFFEMTAEILGKVDAVFDRGSLVALPKDMRDNYTAHLKAISNHAPQLLVCFDYDQSLMSGPPFAISDQELQGHYASTYGFRLASSHNASEMLGADFLIEEKVWLLNAE